MLANKINDFSTVGLSIMGHRRERSISCYCVSLGAENGHYWASGTVVFHTQLETGQEVWRWTSRPPCHTWSEGAHNNVQFPAGQTINLRLLWQYDLWPTFRWPSFPASNSWAAAHTSSTQGQGKNCFLCQYITTGANNRHRKRSRRQTRIFEHYGWYVFRAKYNYFVCLSRFKSNHIKIVNWNHILSSLEIMLKKLVIITLTQFRS